MTVTALRLARLLPGSRNQQFFFVNGRQVKSKLLMAALERAYENQKMVGSSRPRAAASARSANAVWDVNVHSGKDRGSRLLYRAQGFFDGSGN
ncbi:MAG: hypothetical protein ACLUNZ_02340 [Evtepia sp.]